MRLYIKQIVTVVALFVGVISTAQNKVWTLQECVTHALENNITVVRGENTLKINEEDIKGAKGNFLPSVNASLSQSMSLGQSQVFTGSFVDRTSHSTGVSLGVSQSVFNGFRNIYQRDLAELNLETNKLRLNNIRDDISLNVVNAYLNVLFNKENLETAKAQVEFSQKQVNQTKDLVEAGTQPRANIYDAEATLSSDIQRLTVAENNFNLALLSLSQLLQIPYDGFNVEIIEVDKPAALLMYKDIKPILNYAMENRNEIKVAKKNIEVSQLNTKISESGYLPSVNFSYGFGTNAFYSNLTQNEDALFQQLNDNKGHSFSLSVGIPIFSRFQNKTSVAKSKISEENSKLDLQQAKLNLESVIQRAFTDAQAALKTYIAAQKSLESQELAFSNSQDRYNLGSMNSFDLEQARIRLINAQSSLINAKYDFVFKTKILDFYIGKKITL